MNNEQCTIFAQTERSSQMHLDDAEVQPKITQKRSGCVMNDEQWRKVKLEEVGEINPSNKEPIHSQFVYIDLESVVAGKLLVENHILRENAPSRAQRLVYYNDVLYQTVRPYQRNNYIHKKQGNYVASTGYALIRCYDDYEPDFVYYLLHTHNFESIVLGLCTGTSYPAIAPNNLKRIKISIPFKNDKPDFPAQRRIAAILTSADKVIAATQKTIAKYKQMKQGMMEDLLKPKEGWRKVKLGEGIVKSICTGKLDANAMVEGGAYRFYTCAKDYTFIDNYAFDDEALLISGNGEYVGYVHYYKGKFNAYQRTYVLRGFSIDVNYLQCYLNMYLRDRIKKEMNAGSIPFIKMGTLTEMIICYPASLQEQKRMASILNGIDSKIEVEQRVLNKYIQVKKGLMEKLLND